MDSFRLPADLLIGILLGLTIGLCVSFDLDDTTDSETEEDIGFSPQATPRMAHHEAQTHPRPGWWQRMKNLVTSSTSFTETYTDYAAPFIPGAAEHYGIQAYPVFGELSFTPSPPILFPNPYRDAELAEAIWQIEVEQPQELAIEGAVRSDLDVIAAKQQHDELLYWKNVKEQKEEQSARRAAPIIAGGNTASASSTQNPQGSCLIEDRNSDTDRLKPKRARAAFFDDAAHGGGREICLVRKKRTGAMGLSTPAKKIQKKAKHKRARKVVLWLLT